MGSGAGGAGCRGLLLGRRLLQALQASWCNAAVSWCQGLIGLAGGADDEWQPPVIMASSSRKMGGGRGLICWECKEWTLAAGVRLRRELRLCSLPPGVLCVQGRAGLWGQAGGRVRGGGTGGAHTGAGRSARLAVQQGTRARTFAFDEGAYLSSSLARVNRGGTARNASCPGDIILLASPRVHLGWPLGWAS